jgi:hypothetical protein
MALPDRAASARRQHLWATVISLLGAAGIVGAIALHALAAEAAFTERSLERDVAVLRAHHAELVWEITRLATPGRVRAIATRDLGMVVPTTPAVLDRS